MAPQGNDANSGTSEKPFATLERARDAIRALKAKGALPGPVCARLMPGKYLVEKTTELTAADSGTEAAPIVYRADKKGAAVLYGGRRLDGFIPVTDPAVFSRPDIQATVRPGFPSVVSSPELRHAIPTTRLINILRLQLASVLDRQRHQERRRFGLG